MNSRMIIVIFTHSYPYDVAAEHTFLEQEISWLAKDTDKLILVPRTSGGRLIPIPSTVYVDNSFSVYYRKSKKNISLLLNTLASNYFYREIHEHLSLVINPVKLIRLILSLSRAEITKKWFEGWIKENKIGVDQVLLYSYWFDDVSIGLGMVKRKYPQIKFVSRAHGYDIYEELYFPYYWPLRRQTLAVLDKLFPASNDSRDYFRRRYPEFHDLFETAHLGVKEPGFISKPSSDNVLRIVSCAHIVPLKRIDLFIEGIAYAAHIRPDQKFEWIHFGEGKLRRKLQREMKNKFPQKVMGRLPGQVSNQDVMRHYKENPVDVFVNLSTTEGGAPVSIMEAISCGIPVIATNVGGNPEIVSERNGLLLNPDPTPEDVAQALLKVCDNSEMAHKMRAESRKVWQESYNADVNYRNFAERLKSMREG